MPKYLDYHAQLPPMPPAAIEQIKAAIKAGKPNEWGVTPLNDFISTTGQGWCLTEGPNADAVCKTHEAMGIKLDKGEVYEVMTLA